MDNIQQLKKLKELMDEGIITHEEFDMKKKELLEEIEAPSSEKITETVEEVKDIQKRKINKAILKKIGIVVCAVVVLIVVIMGGKSIVKHNQTVKRVAALETGIKSIMSTYDIKDYAVKYDIGYDVYAEGFESLTNGEALNCLVDLGCFSIDDPCGDGEIKLTGNVHPGMDVEYYYWRISSGQAYYFKGTPGNSITSPGIYCNRSGSMKCVYECDN